MNRLVPVYLTMILLATGILYPANAISNVTLDKKETISDQNLLYILLVANIAEDRHMPELALKHYLAAARLTLDPKIAEQATYLAIQTEKPNEAIESATLWANHDLNNIKAQLVAMTLLVGTSVDEAMPYLGRVFDLAPQDIDQQLIEIQLRLSPNSRQQLKLALDRLAQEKSNNAHVQLVAAESAAQEEDIKNAILRVDSALALQPDLTRAIELKARLIRYESDRDLPALTYLSQKVNEYSSNSELRLFYASALIDAEQTREAIQQLTQITEDKQVGGQALVFLGQLYLKENKLQDSVETLKKAISFKKTEDTAKYLLGQLSEQQRKWEEAIEWFSSVPEGPYQIPAYIRAAYLLSANKKYTEALLLLQESNPISWEEEKQLILTEVDILIESNQLENAFELLEVLLPKTLDDLEILYKHSLLAIKLNHLNIAEADLKQILKSDPNHSEALNTLGYLLSVQGREQESMSYLQRALKIAPNNPTYLDSLGWLYYRLKNLKQALIYLKKAQEKSDDTEIAAHLGEVLWVSGDKEKALEIWSQALEKTPKHEILCETLARFKVDIKSDMPSCKLNTRR